MDSSQERDESVERLLRQSRQSLRAPRHAGVTDGCLDAETLAAWADGGLSGAALEAAQSHVAGCSRCQAFVGALARIDSSVPPVEPIRAARGWLPWLVPLTAAAVVVAVWVAVPRQQGDRSAPLPQATAIQEEAKTNPQQPAVPAEPAPPTPMPSEAAQKNAQTPELRRDAAVRSETDRLSKQSAPSNVVAPSASAMSAPTAPAPSAPPSRSASVLDSTGSASLRAENVAIEVVSPDPAVRWRIAGPVVQRSTNGGATWEATSTGIAAELTAGAAPSALVCWVVGRAGVVLLSTDGLSWRRVAFPEPADLSGVRARDARAASVSTADGRTFSTTDAGLTWVPRPLQDF